MSQTNCRTLGAASAVRAQLEAIEARLQNGQSFITPAGAAQTAEESVCRLRELRGWFEDVERVEEEEADGEILLAVRTAPDVDRVRLLCDRLFAGTGITATNLAMLRSMVCRARQCTLDEADELTLNEVADIIEGGQLLLPSPGTGAPADDRSGIQQHAEGVAQDCVLFVVGKTYRAGNGEHCVTDREHAVLQAFLRRGAMDEPTLRRETNLGAKAVPTFKELRQKYDKDFSKALTPPGRKGRGGYRGRVKKAPSSEK